jgi:hypothetical protein
MICQEYDKASNSTCDCSCAVWHTLPLLHLFISHHLMSHQFLVMRFVTRCWVSLSMMAAYLAASAEPVPHRESVSQEYMSL